MMRRAFDWLTSDRGYQHYPPPYVPPPPPARLPLEPAQARFLGLLLASHPRCGARSPARVLCSSPPLVALLWRAIAGPATRTDFVVVVDGSVGSGWIDHIMSFSVCRSLQCLVGGVRTRSLSVAGVVQWVTPRVGVSRGFLRWKDEPVVLRDFPPLCDHAAKESGILATGPDQNAFNSKWFMVYDFWAGSLTIRHTEGWPSSHVEGFDPVTVAVPKKSDPGISFNKVVDDQAILHFYNRLTVELILFDVNLTHKTRSLSVITSAVVPNVDQPLDDVRVMRLRSGAVVFVARRIGRDRDVVLIDPAASEVVVPKRVTGDCSVITQVSSSVFCAWHPQPARSFELWDCNDVSQPLRAINSGYMFSQVVGGRGYLLGVVGGKVVVLEAFTGATVAVLDVSVDVPTATEFLIVNALSLLE